MNLFLNPFFFLIGSTKEEQSGLEAAATNRNFVFVFFLLLLFLSIWIFIRNRHVTS